ncbi:MAG TPA: bacteriohemerythrin [Smithellaceae bacterium]|nr:bacteriohemerythrin [Smithellaceae bacterium]HQM45926.1 bacteriohemerythrin [Smithellaceae bacterium]
MNKITHLEWSPAISVHISKIDDQHKKLFDITNQLIDAFESGAEDMLTIISELVNYTTVHFHEEQVTMMNYQFPGLTLHTREHDKFIEQVEEFLKDYDTGNKDLGYRMVVFLKDWLAAHTSGMDMEYADFVAKKTPKEK